MNTFSKTFLAVVLGTTLSAAPAFALPIKGGKAGLNVKNVAVQQVQLSKQAATKATFAGTKAAKVINSQNIRNVKFTAANAKTLGSVAQSVSLHADKAISIAVPAAAVNASGITLDHALDNVINMKGYASANMAMNKQTDGSIIIQDTGARGGDGLGGGTAGATLDAGSIDVTNAGNFDCAASVAIGGGARTGGCGGGDTGGNNGTNGDANLQAQLNRIQGTLVAQFDAQTTAAEDEEFASAADPIDVGTAVRKNQTGNTNRYYGNELDAGKSVVSAGKLLQDLLKAADGVQ